MNLTKSCCYIAILGLLLFAGMSFGVIAADNSDSRITLETVAGMGKVRAQLLQEIQNTISMSDIRKLLIQEMKAAKGDIVAVDFSVINNARINIVAKLEATAKVLPEKSEDYLTLAYGIFYFGADVPDSPNTITRKKLEDRIAASRQKLAALQKTDDAINAAWEKLNDGIKKAAVDGDTRISACYDSEHITFSDKKFVFKSIDDAKVWVTECTDALKAYNSDTQNNPLEIAKKKMDEFTDSLSAANQQTMDEKVRLEERLHSLDQQSNLESQRSLSQIEQDFTFRKIIFCRVTNICISSISSITYPVVIWWGSCSEIFSNRH